MLGPQYKGDYTRGKLAVGQTSDGLCRSLTPTGDTLSFLSFVPSRFIVVPHLVEPLRWRQNLELRWGRRDDPGIKTREAGTTAAGAGGDAAGDRGLHRAGDEVPAVQNHRSARQAQGPTALATTEC
jgi:hypothetical protein